jgi:hypothetical protein
MRGPLPSSQLIPRADFPGRFRGAYENLTDFRHSHASLEVRSYVLQCHGYPCFHKEKPPPFPARGLFPFKPLSSGGLLGMVTRPAKRTGRLRSHNGFPYSGTP